VKPLPFTAATVTFAVPTLMLLSYVTSKPSRDVTASDFPDLFTMIILTSGFISLPVYSYSSFSSVTTASDISIGRISNVVLTDPVLVLIPFAWIVAVPSFVLPMYTSS